MIEVNEITLDSRNRAVWFVLLSLFLHAILMMVLSGSWTKEKFADSTRQNSVDVQVVPLTQNQIDQIKGQIVETALTEKSKVAAKDAFLGQQTQVVQKQTRSRVTAPYQESRVGGGVQGEQTGERHKVELGSLGVKMNFKPMGNVGPGQTASSSDYVTNIEQGAQTLLNTREYAYFSFYQRVRKQLEQYWEPGLRQRLKTMFDRGRQLAADKEHSTHLTVVMNGEGTITRILVEGTSGFLDLDQAAVEAFNKAGPFPNPPKGMIEHDGTVKIEWEFVLKT